MLQVTLSLQLLALYNSILHILPISLQNINQTLSISTILLS